jgi:diadenosine tetraphosphatase ApaH/serine/threonine PP2A family protein phosphatase
MSARKRERNSNGGAGPPPDDERIERYCKLALNDWKKASETLDEDLIRYVALRAREVVMSEPMLVPVCAPVRVCGDIHGQIHDLVEIFKTGGPPPMSRYLFLGDYVDRGKHGCECITLLLGFKVLYPDQMFLLRGNHESESVCRMYGFFAECKNRFTVKLFKELCDVFNCLPVSGLIEGIALCMHGGLSPELRRLEQIDNLRRPMVVPDSGLACDLLWSDPNDDVKGWGTNDRGVSYTFGADVVRRFCDSVGIDIILRAHQVMENGYCFFADRRLVTIFSASNYCGEFSNNGATMVMGEDCRCSFQIFKPVSK